MALRSAWLLQGPQSGNATKMARRAVILVQRQKDPSPGPPNAALGPFGNKVCSCVRRQVLPPPAYRLRIRPYRAGTQSNSGGLRRTSCIMPSQPSHLHHRRSRIPRAYMPISFRLLTREKYLSTIPARPIISIHHKAHLRAARIVPSARRGCHSSTARRRAAKPIDAVHDAATKSGGPPMPARPPALPDFPPLLGPK